MAVARPVAVNDEAATDAWRMAQRISSMGADLPTNAEAPVSSARKSTSSSPCEVRTTMPSAGWRSRRAVLGGLALAFVYRVLEFVHPAGMGFGDVKLSGVIGMALGWLGWPVLLFGAAFAFILSAVVSLVLLLLRKVTLKSALPFGPFMLLGAFAAVLLS